MVTTDHHKKNQKTEKPKNQKTKKRETRYYTDDYSLPGSLNTRHEKWLICLWLNLHLFCVFFIFIFCKWNTKF